MQIFVDESIHDAAGFIVTSFVATNVDPTEHVSAALSRAGLAPGRDEFKSRMVMNNRPELQNLRDALFGIVLGHAQVGLLITSTASRKLLGGEIVRALSQLVLVHRLDPCAISVIIDSGIQPPKGVMPPDLHGAKITFHQDSRIVVGLQLADLIAGYGALLLLEEFAGPRKIVYLGEESGYEPGTEAGLGWVIRASLRRNFFMETKDWDDPRNAEAGDWFFVRQLLGYGVFLSDSLPAEVQAAAQNAFDITYTGCIH